MRWISIIVALGATVTISSTAVAGGKVDKTKSQEKTARAACLMGDYQTGTKILVDLFIETRNPVYLYNQGRCYEQNHRWEEAVDRFREYLRTVPNPDAETNVDKHLAECEAHLSAPTPVSPPPPPAPPVTAPEPEKPLVTAAPIVPAAATETKESGSALRIVGLVTAAVGVAALGYGTYEYVHHERLVDDLKNKGNQYSDAQFSDKQNQINVSKTRGWIGFGAGAAALVVGTTLYLIGRSSSSSTEAATVTLAPGIGPGQTSLLLSGTF